MKRQLDSGKRSRPILNSAIVVVFLLLTAAPAWNQTISPVVTEAKVGKVYKSQFTARNDTLTTEVVTVTPMSMAVSKGKPTYLPLAENVQVKLSESSFKLGPKQSRTILFEIHCGRCAVAMMTGFMPPRSESGLQLVIKLPNVTYLCADRKGCRDSFIAEGNQ